jgi:hypothetical protein
MQILTQEKKNNFKISVQREKYQKERWWMAVQLFDYQNMFKFSPISDLLCPCYQPKLHILTTVPGHISKSLVHL